MACTIIRLVQAAVNLRRKFECVVQSSFDSMDGEPLEDEEDNEAKTNDESVSSNETELPNEENDELNRRQSIESNQNIDIENSELNEDKMAIDKSKKISSFPNFRFPFSSSNSIFDSQPPKISNIVIYHPFTRVPSINALDSDVLESTTSETDSDTISSIKSVRFRCRDAHSPSSGCKPPKLSRGENVTSVDIMNVTKNSGTWSQSAGTKETTSAVQPVKDKIVGREERKSSSSSGSESCSSGKDETSRRQWLSYSKWILKGQRSMEEEECQEKENRCEPHVTSREIKTENENEEILKSMDEHDEDTDDDVDLNQDIFTDDKDPEEEEGEESDEWNSDELVDEELVWVDSLDEGYVDDYMSFEIDKYGQQEDIIYEEEENQETEVKSKNEEVFEKAENVCKCVVTEQHSETIDKSQLNVENTENKEHVSNSPEDRESKESFRQTGYRYGPDHLPDIPENNLNRSRRERGSKKRLPSIKVKPDFPDSGCHREDSRKSKEVFEDEFGEDLIPSDYDTSQIEVTSPSIVRWSNSQRRSSKGSLKRSFRPHLVQRQRCIQLEEGRSSDDTSDEEKVIFDYSNSSSPRSRARSHSSRGDSFSKDVVLEIDSPQHSQGDKSSRELPLVVVAGPQGSSYVKPLSRNYRSHSSLRVPSPAKSSKRTQRSGGSLDANLGPSNLVSFIGSRKSFEYERRLPASPCDSLTVPHHPSMDPNLREQRRELPLRKYSYSPHSSQHSFRDSVQREFRRSQSERVSGSPSVDTPVRSESVRVSRGRNVSSYSPDLRSPRSPIFTGREHFLGSRSPTKRDEDNTGNELYRVNVIPPIDSSNVTDIMLSSPSPSGNNERFCDWRSESICRQSSLDSGELEDLLNNRSQVEKERLQMQCDSTTPSDEDEPRSKVRYNDMGSLEQVNEAIVDMLEDSQMTITPSSSASLTDYEGIRVQCRALWQLRTTLEEEEPEEESDNGKMEVASSPEYVHLQPSSEVENVTTTTSHTTSMDSSSTSGPQTDPPTTQPQSSVTTVPVPSTSTSFLSSEERRTSYRAILTQKLRHLEASSRPALSSENSFDSVETDWSSTTDLSRAEAITTSVDSTTDSTGETLPHRLHQMKADSGYKSLETAGKSFITKSTAQESFEVQKEEKVYPEREKEDTQIRYNKSWARSSERRSSSRLSAKKRRELLKEWQHVSLDAGLALEAEVNSGDESSGKRSVLARFLRTHRPHGSLRSGQIKSLQRDYSIDEKSDRLFKEFSQLDVPFEGEISPSSRRVQLHSTRRLPRRLDSADSSSPRSHRRKLSPQDSIEEEDQLWEDVEEMRCRGERLIPAESTFSLMEENE